MTKIRKLALVDPDILKNLIAGNCPNNVLNKQMNNKPKTTKTVKHGKGKSVRKARMVAGLASSKVRPSKLGKQRAADAGAVTVIPPPDIRRANALEEELETVLTRRNTKKKNSEKNRRLYNNRLSELMNIRRRRIRMGPAPPAAVISQQQQQLEGTTGSTAAATRRRLTYDSDDDEDGIIWNDASLPQSVRIRAATLLNQLRRNRLIQWDNDTHEMIVDGRAIPGSNIIDLVSHTVSQRQAARPIRGSPGPPPGFNKFAQVLREANVPRALIKNQRRWDEIFGKTQPSPFRDWDSSWECLRRESWRDWGCGISHWGSRVAMQGLILWVKPSGANQ